MKTCSACKVSKPLAEFGSRKSSKDGLQGKCKACTASYFSNYYAEHYPEVRDRVKNNYASNPEPVKARARAWGMSNRAATTARLTGWRAENPEQNKVLRQLHKQTRRGRNTDAGTPDRKHIEKLTKCLNCKYCGILFNPDVFMLNRTIDHVIALSRGGTNHHSNLVAICRSCNTSKATKIAEYEWFPPGSGTGASAVATPDRVEAYRASEVARQRAEQALEVRSKINRRRSLDDPRTER